MDNLLRALRATMDIPKPFGVIHIITLVGVMVLTALLCIFCRNANKKTFRAILLSIWGVMIVIEILRNIYNAYSITESGEIVWGYGVEILPLQLCDAPLYLLPVIALLKDGKLRDALCAFTYTYVLLGGIVTLIVVSSIATERVFLNVQTLIHHSLQIVSSIYIAVHQRKRITIRHFLYGAMVFAGAVTFVTLFNVVMHAIHPDQYINMYFISPYFKRESPVFNDAWMKITGIWQILFYVGGVSAFAFILFMILYGVIRLTARLGERKSPNPVRA